MPKIVGRNERGFVDPLSLFGLLFLVVTLAAVTFVTTNKNISLNIQEKAAKLGKTGNDAFDKCREESGRETCNKELGLNINWKGENVVDTSKVDKDADPKAPTCDANGVQYSAGAVVMYGGIGSNATCGSDGKWDVGVGATTDIKPENVPEYAKEAVEKEKAVEAEKQAAEQLAVGQIDNKLESQESSFIQEVIQQEQKTQTTIQTQPAQQQSVTTVTNSTINTPANVTPTPANRSIAIENRLASMDCSDQGGQYQSATGMCLVSSTSQTLEKVDEGFITNSTTYVRDINTGKIVDAKTTSYIAKTTTTTTQNQGNTVTTSLTSYINPDTGQYYTDSTGKAIINITGLSIIPPLAKKAGGQTCSDSSECGSGSCAYSVNSRVGVSKTCQKEILPNNNYGSCNGDPTCNSALTSIDRGMNAISFGGWSNYTEAYSPDKVKYTWQENGYKSVKECQDDMIAKNHNSQAAASCNTYQITKEQATTSIKLGTTLTAEAAVIIALPGAIGAGGTAITAGATTLQVGGAVLAPALTSFGAITTLTQTSAAAVAQITDPGSPEAWKQTGYAALSWLNIGTADKLIKSFGALDAAKKAGLATESLVTAAQSARNLNNVVSGINLAVDVPNAVSTCSQAGFFTGSCGGALAAVGADIVFGTVDYKQGQLGFGNPLTKVNEGALIGPLPDIKDPNGTRIATPAEIDQINQLIANPFGTTPSISNVDGEVKFTPSRQLDMFDQLARDPVANTSTVVNNGSQLIIPDKNPAQDPNHNFNLTKSDPNEVAAIAAFNSTDINTQGGTVAQLTPSNLNSQIPNTPITDVTAPKPVEPNANIADDITKPLTGTANTDTVDSPATTNQSPTIASLLDDPNASVLDKANGVIDTLPDTGGAISIVKKINQIGDEIAKVDVNTPKPLRERLFGEPKTKKFSNVKTGETILIKPGDTIRTGNFETKMPKPDDYPDGIFWTKNPGDTPQRLTGEGVPITKGNSAENINFADKDGGRIVVDVVEHTTDANGRPITKPTASTAITLTDELNVQTTITRAASETGLLTFRGPDGEWFPGLKKLFGNGKPAAPTSNEAVIGPSEKLVDPETSANNSGATNNEKTVSTTEELFDHFKKEYKSELPENLVVHKDPNDFYSFQQELIDAAKNGEITDEFLAQKMRDLQGRGNVTFVIKNPGEINDISGGIAYTQKVLNPKTGKYEITVFLPSPADLAEYKNIDIEPARIKIAELIGHEAGHAYDEVGLSAIGVNPNSSGGLWATEYLQQNFSNEFQKALGVENPVKDGFVKGVEAQANIIKNTSGEPLPATKQPSAFVSWWDEKVTNPVGDLIFGKKPIFLDNLDTPLAPITREGILTVIKPTVEMPVAKIPYSNELDPLIEIKNAWNKYGDRLTTAYNNKDAQGLIDIAKENGYQVKIVPFGEKVDIVEIGGKIGETTKMPMTKADTVRIGKSGGKKTLFIATTDVSNPTFKIDDLAHDIGAVITDVKFIPIEKIYISPSSFADFMTKATNKYWQNSDITHKVFGTTLNVKNNKEVVPITYIVDALTFGEVPSNFLESVPVKPITGFAKIQEWFSTPVKPVSLENLEPKVFDATGNNMPKATEITIPQKFTNWWDEKITNPLKNLLPTSKNDKIAYQNALDKLADSKPSKTDIANALLAEGYNPSKINDEVINNTANELIKINNNNPKAQAINIAIEKINETKIDITPKINDDEGLVGYQQGSASRIYQPQKDIRTAIENVPDPLNIIKEMKKANTPEEVYTILIKKLEENGVIIIKNPLDENLDIYIPGKEGFSIPIDTPGRYLGAYYDGTESINFSTYTQSSIEFPDVPRKSYIFLHPQFDSLPIGTRIKTVLHETGHYIEQVHLPGVINPNVKTSDFLDGRSAIERPITEYVSSLYGANGALISAKFGGPQAAIDAGLVAQIELNAKVLGNPDGYLPKAGIPKPSVEKTTIPQKFINWAKAEMAKTNPDAFDNLKNGFELRSPIGTDGKLQLPFEKVTLPKNIEPEIDLNKLEVKDVPSWENVKNKEVATIIDVENIDSIPPLKGRDFIPQVKPVRELYPVEIVNNLFFSEKSADSGRKLVQDYLQALKNGEDVSEYQKIAKSFLNDQEKVYGTQSQSAKSKLASWISRNYNDVDVNSLPTENIDDLALVRVMSSPDPIGVDPYGNVVIQSTFLGNPQKDAESLYRTSKHFTVNGAVAPVQTAYGRIADWSAGDVIVITPMNEFVKINGTPNTFAVQDTWWTPGTYDNLVLPKGTVLIIKDGSEALKEYANLPGVLIIKSENPYRSSRIVLEQSGYQYKAQGTEYSEPDTPEEVFLNESVFAYNIGANSGLHFDSPTMNVGNELSTRLLIDETINDMSAWSEGNLSRHQRLNTVVDLIQDGYFSHKPINGLYIPPERIPNSWELTPDNFDGFTSPLTNSQIKAVEDIISNEKLTLPNYWENQGVIAEYQQLIKDSFVDPTLSSGLPFLKPDIFGLTNEDTNFLRQNVNELTKTTIPVSSETILQQDSTNVTRNAGTPAQTATTTSERPSILTQVQDWWKANIADEQGFLPSVRRFLNPVPTQKLTTDEVTNLINNTNGPIIEVGGPTPGYKQVYIPELNRNIYVSNIETGTPVIENGVQIGSTVNGHVDLLTNSTKLPFADNSVGAIFGSALEEQTIPQTLSEAYRTLKPDGVLVLQNAKSIENQAYAGIIAEAEKLGFKPLSNIEIYRFPGKSDNVLRDLVFQKTEIITPSPPLTGFAKVQEQAEAIAKDILDGSVPTGVGLSPLKYVAGGIIYNLYQISDFARLINNYGWDNTGALLKDWWQDRNPFSSTLPTSETPTGDEKVSESSLINVVNPPLAIPPVIPDSPAKTNEQQKLEIERQAKIKSGLYAQIDADLATQTISGGAGKPFKNIGCGQVAVANILCEYGNYCPTPLQIAEQIPLHEYAESGLTSTQSNIKILNENGFTTDPYTKSLQYHLTEYMEPTDILWISGIVGGINHHTYINGYTINENGVAIFNLNDSYFGDGYKCKTSGDSSFSCDNPDGSHINIGAENANIYIIDTNI